MGGPRFEQLFRTTGRLRVGDEEYELNGAGLRIRRAGIRRLATFRGHVWQSTVFPSGRAFGLCLYPPRDDGKATFNEGFLFEGDGAPHPGARGRRAVVADPRAPRVRTCRSRSRPRTGRPRPIQGETVLSTFHVMNAAAGAAGMVGDFRLQQAIVQYTWDGETATGMLERSSASSQVDLSAFGRDTTAEEIARSADLRGRLAVLTGASSGIGVETARGLALAGADVVLGVRDVTAGEAVAHDLAPEATGELRVARPRPARARLGRRVRRRDHRARRSVDRQCGSVEDARRASPQRARRAVRDQPSRTLRARTAAARPDGGAGRAHRAGELGRAQGRAGAPRRSPVAGPRPHRRPGLRRVEERQHPLRAGGDPTLGRRRDLRQRGAPGLGTHRVAAVPRRRAEAPDRLHPARRLAQSRAEDGRAGRGDHDVGGHRTGAGGTRRPRARGLRRGAAGGARHAPVVGVRRERRRSRDRASTLGPLDRVARFPRAAE